MAFQPTLRLTKGARLTFQEMDDNFQGLADAIVSGVGTTFDSFTEMVAADLTKQNLVHTKSYYDGQGKGAGTYLKTDETGTAGETNGGTYFHDSDGFKWVLRHNGTVSIDQFGFVADFVLTSDSGSTSTATGTDNSTKLQAMFDDANISKILGASGQYWFGIINANQYKTTCSRPIEIDWSGAELFCAHVNPNAASISSTLIRFLNTDLVHMHSFEFTQINWNASLAAGAGGRGVNPYIFSQTTGAGVLNRGVRLGNYTVHKGQSLVGFASDTVAVDRIEGVDLYGSIVGNSVYYGYNLFYSGHNIKGRIKIKEYIRAWILNDIVDADLELLQEGNLAIATSSSGLISNSANGLSAFNTERLKIKAKFDQINGPIRLSGPDAQGSNVNLSNINLDVFINDFGTNLDKVNGSAVILGSYDGGGTYITTGTLTAKDNVVKIRVGAPLDQCNNLFLAQTRTPNSERNLIDAQRFDVSSFQNELIHYRSPFGACIGHRGNLTTKSIEMSMKKFLDKTIGPDPFYVTVDAIVSESGTPANHRVQRWVLYGNINSDGTETILTATKVYEAGGGTYNPTLQFATSPTGSPFVTVNAASGGSANGRLTLLIRPASSGVTLI